jgi:TrmH family RNA methyltransferase
VLSKNDQKRIRKLRQKKYRGQWELFIAEGAKVVGELLQNGFEAEQIWSSMPDGFPHSIQVASDQLAVLSGLETSPGLLAVFKQKLPPIPEQIKRALVLDGVRDPGNMGTLLRLADWFGLDAVLCTTDCVEIWNPKTVQSAMGSLGRVAVMVRPTSELTALLSAHQLPILGAALEGDSIYSMEPIPQKFALCMGSESHGFVSFSVDMLDQCVRIPRAPGRHTESLNVAVAAGILLGYFCKDSKW